MDHVGAVQDRDAETGANGGLLVSVDHREPVLGGVVACRIAVAPGDDAAEQEVGSALRIDALVLDLGHLADLLVEGHLSQQRSHPLVERQRRVEPRTSRLGRTAVRRRGGGSSDRGRRHRHGEDARGQGANGRQGPDGGHVRYAASAAANAAYPSWHRSVASAARSCTHT